MLELYQYELSDIWDQDLDEDGEYGYDLTFFLEEVGPTVYNKAVAEVQERMQARVLELDIEIHEDEFQYWPKQVKSARPRR